MRWQTAKFVENFLAKYPHRKKKVLEVGSAYVNGDIRGVFGDVEYTGLDINNTRNVDLAINAHDIKSHLKEESFDLVCSFDTFEHDDAFWITLENMKWSLKKGGWLLLGVPGRFCPIHDHPSDYWRFMKSGFELFFSGYEDIYIDATPDAPSREPEDEFYGWGRKPL